MGRVAALAAAILSILAAEAALAQRWDDPKTWGIVPDDAAAPQPPQSGSTAAGTTAGGTPAPQGAQVASTPAPKPYDPSLTSRKTAAPEPK